MKLQWFEQEQATSCVAACVRMVLSGYDAAFSEAEIREWLENPRRRGFPFLSNRLGMKKAFAGGQRLFL